MNEQLETNRRVWDEWAAIHARGASNYRVEEFKAGRAGWEPNIPDALGSVEGKSILHLQCHFGMDSLMWARRGARVTGVDFSTVAIQEARALSREVGVHADFVCADIYALAEVLSGDFDIVLTYGGTIVWLPDLSRWAVVIAHFLKPGGLFYMADDHPFAHMLEADPETGSLELANPYFEHGAPQRCESNGGTYAAPQAHTVERVTYQWQHSLAEIVTVLLAAGLRLETLREFPFSTWDRFGYNRTPVLEEAPAGRWRPRRKTYVLPLTFSLKASKT